MKASEEVSGGLLVTRGDGAEVLDDIEEAFHEPPLAIEREVAFPVGLAVRSRWNDRFDPTHVKMVNEAVAVVAFIADESGGLDLLRQGFGLHHVVNMSAGEADRQRIAQGIDDCVDFGRQSAARAPDRFVRIPLFRAPALCWWALMMVASIMAYSLSGSSAKVLKRLSQTPLSAHREKRL